MFPRRCRICRGVCLRCQSPHTLNNPTQERSRQHSTSQGTKRQEGVGGKEPPSSIFLDADNFARKSDRERARERESERERERERDREWTTVTCNPSRWVLLLKIELRGFLLSLLEELLLRVWEILDHLPSAATVFFDYVALAMIQKEAEPPWTQGPADPSGQRTSHD